MTGKFRFFLFFLMLIFLLPVKYSKAVDCIGKNYHASKTKQLHPDLLAILKQLGKVMDYVVIEGKRSKERQLACYKMGLSRTLNSKHLVQSTGYAHAVDISPYPVSYKDKHINRFIYMQGIVQGIASVLGIQVRSGIDWDGDGEIVTFDRDESFFDGAHVELRN